MHDAQRLLAAASFDLFLLVWNLPDNPGQHKGIIVNCRMNIIFFLTW